MKTRRLLLGSLALLTLIAAAGPAGAAPLPVLDAKPQLQVDPGGPAAAVTALAFSPDGKTLYAGGLDKVVRVYKLRDGLFVLDSTIRVPVGPGNLGAVNAIALSPDGDWLARPLPSGRSSSRTLE
jgi:WD40 repeat protein